MASSAPPMADPVVALPRGGLYVKTAAGPIQFGMPPETIKDSMSLKLEVPTIFVVPSPTFDRSRGVSVSELEFPAYYNFFLRKRAVCLLLADEEEERRFRLLFKESLFGPDGDPSDEEFADEFSRDARPDFAKESAYFRQMPDGSFLELDQVVHFFHFGSDGRVILDKGVEVHRNAQDFVVLENGRELVRLPTAVKLPEAKDEAPAPVDRVATGEPLAFEPPAFGVTILGNSHGFDPCGKTTGFILWVGHRGILIDPPVNTTEILRQQGLPPKLIDGIILTHCHADHDSGTFQKIFEEGCINLYTTPHILKSFLTKYSNLTGLQEDLLRRTFTFQPVRIGAPTRVHGAEIYFFYTLHSIPTVGFEVYYGNKSLVFSGDTLYEPERIDQIHQQGVISDARRQHLLAFPWYHSVVLHEAGVPGIHTPVKILSSLSEDVKKRLYLVHIAERDMPAGSGLKNAKVGFGHTIRIEVEPPRHHEAIELLDIFCAIDLFRAFPMSRAREILNAARKVRFSKGTKIITQGDVGNSFYIVATGVCSVFRDGAEIKSYQTGDYFGETALVLGQRRNADVVAVTDVELVEVDRYDFLYFLRGTDVRHRLSHLAQMREERSWQVIESNSALRGLTSAQKNQLQSLLVPKKTRKNQILWSKGKPAKEAVLIDTGSVSLDSGDPGLVLKPFGVGAFVGEVDALRNGHLLATTAKVEEGGRIFCVSRRDLCEFFNENPGVLILFLGTRFFE